MLEEVRVHVDQDTEAILEKITQGIVDHLSETPFWTREFSRDLKDQLSEIFSLQPSLVEREREKLTQSLQQRFDRIETVVRESQAFEQAALQKLSELIRAAVSSAEELNSIKADIQRHGNDGHLFREAIKEQIDRIADSLMAVQGESQHRHESFEVRYQELSSDVSTLLSVVQAQSATLAACQEELAMINRPWWKKLLWRGK